MAQLLLIDDEKDNTFVFTSILRADGYLVDEYNDPIKALSAYRPKYYDLIILDYRMAGLNGLGFIQKVKEIDRSAKAILITAWELRSLGKMIQKYFIRILSKPISEEELLKEVRFALKQDGTQDTTLKI
jgi:DNA-binding NtrC family response regulator